MKVKLDGATYIVEQFEEEHNHNVLKKFDLGKYLRSHRHMPREEREFVKLLHACNLQTSQMMQILSTLHGKLNDLLYTRTDMANFRAALRREHRVMDMKYTLRYFKKLKKEDDDFFYSFELDDEDRVINLYWIDAEARRSYKYYSGCISFDTTYLTNKYNMPCAPFIGINNHYTLSFVWLLNTFLEAMDGIAPANIIIDQDFAMRNAISEVFPETRHRNCRWHIMKKAQEKMGGFMVSTQRSEGFNAVLKDMDGIVCCHILRVMQREGVRVLPQHYILKRWTWNADAVLGPHGTQQLNPAQQEMPENSRKLMRYATMKRGFGDIAKEACDDQ
ncbi:hypothetical protein BRADI_2g23413v3 [Brachypodium distachyon]|uniref:MULE transposase domain-containing protein n=1 Tax=Brachypodium distachyon TaxID=15368 RepID=A0A2K2DA07_BRADI|nr:hypothetical protein BRADI_2g23413v3 [Brachypodium distachyon]